MECQWETQKNNSKKRVGKGQVVQPYGTSWDKLQYGGQVGQGEGGLQILVGQVRQGERGLQIFVGQVGQGQGICRAEPEKTRQNGRKMTSFWGTTAKLGACVDCVNRVDWLRTSADKRMWSGWRAVMMVWWAAIGCGCSALIRRPSWTGNWTAGHEGYHPPDCNGQEEGQSFLASNWASLAVPAALSFQTCFACVHMYILYACVYICVCVYVCGHDICIYMHVCMYLYIYAFIHVCMCMCMHICA